MRIEVKTENEDKTLNVYVFTTMEMNAILLEVNQQYKLEGMKVWKVKSLWDRYNEKESIIKEPVLTDEVKKLVIDEMSKHILVANWSEVRDWNEFKSIK